MNGLVCGGQVRAAVKLSAKAVAYFGSKTAIITNGIVKSTKIQKLRYAATNGFVSTKLTGSM